MSTLLLLDMILIKLSFVIVYEGDIGPQLYPISREGNGSPLQYSCLGKSHGRWSLVGCSPWGHKELDTTDRLHFHFSLSCIGEGSGNPLQCFSLENPRDGEAWWAAICGVAQSRTRLKRLSSSRNFEFTHKIICVLEIPTFES